MKHLNASRRYPNVVLRITVLLSLREAYVEWRREALRGRGDDFCDEQAGLSGFGCSKHVLNTY